METLDKKGPRWLRISDETTGKEKRWIGPNPLRGSLTGFPHQAEGGRGAKKSEERKKEGGTAQQISPN